MVSSVPQRTVTLLLVLQNTCNPFSLSTPCEIFQEVFTFSDSKFVKVHNSCPSYEEKYNGGLGPSTPL